MSLSRANSSKVIGVVLTVSFAFLAGIIMYATWVGGSFQLRSKATDTSKAIVNWVFKNGLNGWSAVDFKSASITKSALELVIHPEKDITKREEYCTGQAKNNNLKCKERTVVVRQRAPHITKSGLNAVMQFPVNTFKMELAIVPAKIVNGPTPTPMIWQETAGNTNVDKNRKGMAPIYISYRIKGKNKYEDPMLAKVLVNGELQQVVLTLPSSMNLKTIDAVTVSFKELVGMKDARIRIENIGFFGMNEASTEPGETPPNCHYQDVQCVQAPCDPILVCDSPIPTP